MTQASQVYKDLPKEEVDRLIDRMGHTFKTPPMYHQKVGMLFSVGKDGVGLFYDIGTGKTLTSLYVSKYIWKCKKILVICPTTAISTWKEQVAEHADYRFFSPTGSTVEKRSSLRAYQDTPGVFCLNYEALRGVFGIIQKYKGRTIVEVNGDFFNSLGFDCIIFDESHHIKNFETQQTKLCMGLSSLCKHNIVMSGTPVTEKYENLWPQIYCLDKGKRLGDNYFLFLHRYFYKIFYNWKLRKGNDTKILAKIEDTVLFYSKDECFDLPELTFEKRLIAMSSEQADHYFHIRSGILDMYEGNVSVDTILKEIMKLRQITGGFLYTDRGETIRIKSKERVSELQECVQQCLCRKGKIIIYYTFREEANIIREALKGIATFEVPKNSKEVSDKLHWYKSAGGPRIIIASRGIFSESANFTEANTIINYSPDYSGEKRCQSVGRIHRKGQWENCLIMDLLCEFTVDIDVYDISQGKIKTQKELVEYFRNRV